MERQEFRSAQTAVIYYAHYCNPRRVQVYFHWLDIWQRYPDSGRGRLREPYYELPQHGDALFWELLDLQTAEVQCFAVQRVLRRLEAYLGVQPTVLRED